MPRFLWLTAFVSIISVAASAQPIRDVRVQFRSGTSGAVVDGRITGTEIVDYVLRANAGQRLIVALQTNNPSNYFNVTAPGASAAMFIGSTSGNRFETIIPSSGDYRVRVYLMRNAARRGEAATYALSMNIVGGGQAASPPPPDYADGMAGGPDFWVVTGVAGNDRLNLRAGPATGYEIVARVRNGTILRNLGCRPASGGRWCRVGLTDDAATDGWANGRFLRESGPPSYGGGAGGTTVQPGSAMLGVPELYLRPTGEAEVRWRSGCTVLYASNGPRINAGGTCSAEQLYRSDDAVERFRREQGL